MGSCYAKGNQTDQTITVNINDKTPLINNHTKNIQIIKSSTLNNDGYNADCEDNFNKLYNKIYDQYTIDELINELEKNKDHDIINIIIGSIGRKMNIMTLVDINRIWKRYHSLIINKIKDYPWLCIDLKLNLVINDDKIKYIEEMANAIYDLYPNEAVILLHTNIQKATLLIKKNNGKICEELSGDNIRQQLMINNALVSLSRKKYGLAYLLLLKTGRYTDAYNIFNNFVPEYVKLLIH